MMDISIILIAVVVFLISYLYLYRRDVKYANLPPGPRPLPIIGTLYKTTLSMEFAKTVRKAYGDIAVFYDGPIRTVYMNSYELIKEITVAKGKLFSDRGFHNSYSASTTNPHSKGIIESDFNERLRHDRNASLSIFRNLGVGRSIMEERIIEEGATMVKNFKNQNGTPFDPSQIVTCAVTNVILSVVINKRHNHDDKEFLEVIKSSNVFISSAQEMTLIDGLPILRFLPYLSSVLADVIKGNKTMIDHMWKYAQKLTQNSDNGPEIASNFVSEWVKRFNESQKETEIDEENLKYILRDMLIAGFEQTTNSLKWMILELANRPDIQAKAQEEIDGAIGKDTQITIEHKKSLPYVEALICEIQRFDTVAPYSVPHYATEDLKVGAYDIPKDSVIITNLHGVHMDEDTFGDPEVFRPERFINADGKFEKHSKVIPFSIGKRSCLGELLARQELFLLTAILLQKFTVSRPDGISKLDDKGIFGFTYKPKPFEIRAIPR